MNSTDEPPTSNPDIKDPTIIDDTEKTGGDTAPATFTTTNGEEIVYTTPPKGYRLFGSNIILPAYRSPIVQCIIIACVHLLVVGMFNVLSALGGGGQVDPTTSNNANTILYSLFAFFALTAGSVVNFLGPKVTLAMGGVGYSLLSASFWSYNHNSNAGFVYFGGAMCGIAAAFLWYPHHLSRNLRQKCC
jgi:hypothetical protein